MTLGRGPGWATGAREKRRGHRHDRAGFAGVTVGWARGPRLEEVRPPPHPPTAGFGRGTCVKRQEGWWPGTEEGRGGKEPWGEPARAEQVAMSWRWGSLGRMPSSDPRRDFTRTLSEAIVPLPFEGKGNGCLPSSGFEPKLGALCFLSSTDLDAGEGAGR